MKEPEIYVNLSYNEQSTLGNALYHFWYSNGPLRDLAPGKSGYPHNGGEHTLSIRGSKGDCLAFLELMRDTYPKAAQDLSLLIQAIEAGKSRVRFRELVQTRVAA